jgi:hypothetical protein
MSVKYKISDREYSVDVDSMTLYYVLDVNELKQIKEFTSLKYLGLGSSNINDEGLKYISESSTIDNLNLQCTEVTDQGIAHLSNLKSLKYLRLKECDYITNKCVPYFNNMDSLIDLQIHDTDIDQHGLKHLNLPNLQYLCIIIWNDNFSFEFLLDYSNKFPKCEILVKGKGTFLEGAFEGEW